MLLSMLCAMVMPSTYVLEAHTVDDGISLSKHKIAYSEMFLSSKILVKFRKRTKYEKLRVDRLLVNEDSSLACLYATLDDSRKSNFETHIWFIDVRKLSDLNYKEIDFFITYPIWADTRKLFFEKYDIRDNKDIAYTLELDKENNLVQEDADNNFSIPVPHADMASDYIYSRGYENPRSAHGIRYHLSTNFSSREGIQVVSPDGDLFLACVGDEDSKTGARCILFKKTQSGWNEITIDDKRFPLFHLSQDYIGIESGNDGKRNFALYNIKRNKIEFNLQGERFDIAYY